jgi:hypothetical protein
MQEKDFESKIAQRISAEAGIGSRVVTLLLERAVREGYDLAVDEIAGA